MYEGSEPRLLFRYLQTLSTRTFGTSHTRKVWLSRQNKRSELFYKEAPNLTGSTQLGEGSFLGSTLEIFKFGDSAKLESLICRKISILWSTSPTTNPICALLSAFMCFDSRRICCSSLRDLNSGLSTNLATAAVAKTFLKMVASQNLRGQLVTKTFYEVSFWAGLG